jgi:leader peptidase (prepilin peptidase)/N-methyltransferase
MRHIAIPIIVLACHLAVISWIDFARHVIPNLLNLSLALCGLVASVLLLDKSVVSVLLASGLIIVVFLLISKAYTALRGKQGIGMGDVKFLGAAATWVGFLGIPWIILIASISGLMFVIIASLIDRDVKVDSRIAFGPHLSLGLMTAWLLRDVIHV